MLKPELRIKAKQIRQTLNRPALSLQIMAQLISVPDFQACQHCLLFYPISGEVDLRGLLSDFPEKHFYLPRITETDTLSFHQYKIEDEPQLICNLYKIKEPLAHSPAFLSVFSGGLKEKAMLIAPALMADSKGYRLGYGKSYYDRYFASLLTSSISSTLSMSTAVVIPEALLVDELPRYSWDKPLDWVVTDQRVIKTPQRFSNT